ncbi:hypothetical protein Pmani_039068 [Petrolisthes manimaculis]|uniref:Uncharacterized protein n=1 Tax=Petrolisthes manimaculis TaxID=1843537 RepID=A0AAE1NDF4_9EUCA|nr:hypothetical protein Pmani_039068 [Petrolisthes manimaculis]
MSSADDSVIGSCYTSSRSSGSSAYSSITATTFISTGSVRDGSRRNSLDSLTLPKLTLIEHISQLGDTPGQPPPCVFCSPPSTQQASTTTHAPATLSALTGGSYIERSMQGKLYQILGTG